MFRRLIIAVEALSKTGGVAAALLLIAAMSVMCQMIFMRYVFQSSTIWQTEFVVFTATAAIFIGAPYVLMKKGHVGVDVLELILSPTNCRRLQCVGAVLGLVFCCLMAIASAIYVFEAWEGGWTTSTIAAIPLWIPATPMLVGFALLCLQYVVEIIKLLNPQLAEQMQSSAETASANEQQTLGDAK